MYIPPKHWISAATWVFVAASLAGCNRATPSPNATAPAQLAELAATATPDPNTIVWAVPAPPTTLDPARMNADPVGEQIAGQVYDRLVRFRPGTAQLAPGLAARWEADIRANTFTFTLRPGLTFHDGTPLDEQAVVWNFERWMNSEHPAHLGRFLPWQGLFGGFLGQVDSQGKEAWLIESVEAIGPLQVRFKLRAPFTPFLHHLAMIPFGLASPTAVAAQGESYGSDPAHLPVGSGPFRVTGWDADGTVRLRPFDAFWGGVPANPGLDFVVIADDQARAAAVAAGAAHGTDLAASTPISGSLTAPGVTVMPRPARDTTWLMLNQGRPPLDNPRVRQAISMAIDRGKLAAEHFGPHSIPASQLLPPGFLGHNPDVTVPNFDPEGAKQILADVGAGGGFPLNIWVPEEARPFLPDPGGTAGALAEMLKAIGINAAVRTQAPRQFLRDRDNGRFTAWVIGWRGQSADPDNYWFWHFGVPSRIVSEGNYNNSDLATSLRDAQRILDSEERAGYYRRAAETVDKDSARIFLVHPQSPVLVSNRLNAYHPSPLGFDDFAHVVLSPLPPGMTAAPLATFRAPTLTPTTVLTGTPGVEVTPAGSPTAGG